MPEPDQDRASPTAWYVLFVLVLICITNYIDRNIMSIVLPAVKGEFDLSDSQLGALGGLIHAVAYTAMVVPLGLLVDRMNRVRLLAAVLFIWSGMTALTSQVTSYLGLVLTRAGVGVAEAGGIPVSVSLISDYFSSRRRATAIGIFFASGPIGFAISFGVGGYLVEQYGWRLAFLAASIPGFVLVALLWFTVRETRAPRWRPPAGSAAASKETAPTLLEAVRVSMCNKPLCATVAGLVLTALTLSAFWVWIFSFLTRIHGMSLASAGLLIAFAAGLTGAIGGPLGGYLSDRWSSGSPRKAGRFVALVQLIILPFAFLTLTTDNLVLLFAGMAVWQLLMPMYLGPGYGVCVGLVEPRMRGTVLSFIQGFSNLVGFGLGPFLVGLLSDAIGGDDSLQLAMVLITGINLIAALMYWMGARTAPESVLDEVQADDADAERA